MIRTSFTSALLGSLLFAAGDAFASEMTPLELDRHALTAPADPAEKSLDWLAEYLFFPAHTDRDKARVIFRWMTDRIAYDMDALHTGNPGDVRPDMVLRSRKARGAGYAALFDELARRAGLRSLSIAGYVKEFVVTGDARSDVPPPNHVWNAVKINGCWQLVDTACGAGQVKGQRFHKQFREQYFLTPPTQLIWTHYPENPAWQLLPRPLTFDQFEALSPAKVGFLRLGVAQQVSIPDKGKPPTQPYSQTSLVAQAGAVKMLEGPMLTTLKASRDYHFLIEAPHAQEMILQNNYLRYPMRKIGTRFEITVLPEPGELKLLMRSTLRPGLLQHVMTYQVSR